MELWLIRLLNLGLIALPPAPPLPGGADRELLLHGVPPRAEARLFGSAAAVQEAGWLPVASPLTGGQDPDLPFPALASGADRTEGPGSESLRSYPLVERPSRVPAQGSSAKTKAWQIPAGSHGLLVAEMPGNLRAVASASWTIHLPGHEDLLLVLWEESDYGNSEGSLRRLLQVLLPEPAGTLRELWRTVTYSEAGAWRGGPEWSCRAALELDLASEALILSRGRMEGAGCSKALGPPARYPLAWLLSDSLRRGVPWSELPEPVRASLVRENWVFHFAEPEIAIGEDLDLDGRTEWLVPRLGQLAVLGRQGERWTTLGLLEGERFAVEPLPRGGWRPLRVLLTGMSGKRERAQRRVVFRQGRYR